MFGHVVDVGAGKRGGFPVCILYIYIISNLAYLAYQAYHRLQIYSAHWSTQFCTLILQVLVIVSMIGLGSLAIYLGSIPTYSGLFQLFLLQGPCSYWCLAGNGWDWGNGMIIDSYRGSFPHSLLSTSKCLLDWNPAIWYPSIHWPWQFLMALHDIPCLGHRSQSPGSANDHWTSRSGDFSH
jgi:hypothetical protein